MQQLKLVVMSMCSVLLLWALSTSPAVAQITFQTTGAGNTLLQPWGIAVDGSGNAYVTGSASDNAFKITPGGVITEIIDSTGDGLGNTLDDPRGIAVEGSGNAYVTGSASDNAFKIAPGGVITEIIDSTGGEAGNKRGHPYIWLLLLQ